MEVSEGVDRIHVLSSLQSSIDVLVQESLIGSSWRGALVTHRRHRLAKPTSVPGSYFQSVEVIFWEAECDREHSDSENHHERTDNSETHAFTCNTGFKIKNCNANDQNRQPRNR